MRHVQKMLLLLLLIIALGLWLPLLKWQRLFEAAPKVRFAVPSFQMEKWRVTGSLPAVPKLTAVKIVALTAVQLAGLHRLNLPVFAKDGHWFIGPYLDSQEAAEVGQQVFQNLKITVTIVRYE